MRRFAENRWWTIILTLCVLLASSATLSTPSFGEGQDPFEIGDPSPPPPGGDPDGPSGPSKYAPSGGRAVRQVYHYTAGPVGDGGSVASVWSWRFHVALRSLIGRYIRF